ncbi:chromate transporter [Chitinophaga ginsengisoli]|uniref:Chromate transporter n=1 Tax=Chitinophaga ginsengisoli TaxID=363837 RepID=A0A2P8GL19_9BACT|nr:chromate transporter [Chitinophaga ginsengisoli]PSL34645.1 chromate transporter [Chitinophaga ginsengisoli]
MNEKQSYTLAGLVKYFLKLGAIGFGGPVALVGYMNRDLVEERRWIMEEDYKEGLALAQLAPGPLAAQLAIYIGYVDYKLLGATLVGLAFVLPSFLMVVALGIAYVQFGGLPWMQALFYGIGAAVIGIIAVSSYKLTKKSLGRDWLLWIIFGVLMVATFIYEKELLWLILLGGIAVWMSRTRPRLLNTTQSILYSPVLLQVTGQLSADEKLVQTGWFFLKAGAFVFGSGLAIVPFLYGGVVKEYQWLSEQQFLDAVAVAMITPGPVVITVGFIGYLVAGLPGACVAALATFLPCYLFTILPAPYFKKYGKHAAIKAFIDGVTAAATGAIAGAVLVLAKRQFTDITSVVIALGTILILLNFKKISELLIIALAAAAGLLIKFIPDLINV